MEVIKRHPFTLGTVGQFRGLNGERRGPVRALGDKVPALRTERRAPPGSAYTSHRTDNHSCHNAHGEAQALPEIACSTPPPQRMPPWCLRSECDRPPESGRLVCGGDPGVRVARGPEKQGRGRDLLMAPIHSRLGLTVSASLPSDARLLPPSGLPKPISAPPTIPPAITTS